MMRHQKAPPRTSNKDAKSLVKVIASTDVGKWCSPASGSTFAIDATPAFPRIPFEIDTLIAGPYQWSWSITWNAKASGMKESSERGATVELFSERGSFESTDKLWVADPGRLIGGVFTVEVRAGGDVFRRSVTVKGTNPSMQDVLSHLATQAQATGFEKIIEQESGCKNFINADGQPIVAFDRGYGMVQITHPAPTFEQCWNWKLNLAAGLGVYRSKGKTAMAYLGQAGRTYTPQQLQLETLSLWNGGRYHKWDDSVRAWVRNDDILCDTRTGNIGWRLSEADNAGRSESALHSRDVESYGNPKNKGETNKWIYTGVCYADHLDRK